MPELRPFGGSGLRFSPLCLGGNVFGWSAGEDASFAVLDAYVDSGGNVIDTANVYSAWVPGNEGGESETIIGRWIAGRGGHDDVVVATKVGMAGGPSQPKGLTRDKIRRGLEASLGRLGLDRIDLCTPTRTTPTRTWPRRWARSTRSSARAWWGPSRPRTTRRSGSPRRWT